MNKIKHDSKFYLVSKLPIFSNLSENEIQLITNSCRLVEFERNEVLYIKGEIDKNLYILLSGTALIYDELEDEGTAKEEPIEVLRRGDILGLVSFLNKEPHSFFCRAVSDLRALKFEHSTLKKLIDKVPYLSFQFSLFLSKRIRDLRTKEVYHQPNAVIGFISFLEEEKSRIILEGLNRELKENFRKKIQYFSKGIDVSGKQKSGTEYLSFTNFNELEETITQHCRKCEHLLIPITLEDLKSNLQLEKYFDIIYLLSSEDTIPPDVQGIIQNSDYPDLYKLFSIGVNIKPEFFENRIRILAKEILGNRIGIAFGGGAALGLAQIGIIQVLEESNIPIDIISGTSIGSVIGGLWAAGITGKQMEEICAEFDSAFKMIKLLDITIPKQGLLSGKNVLQFLENYLQDITFNELKIPFRAVACDILTRNEIIIKTGKVSEGIRASAAIPGVFAPIQTEDKILVDGGVVDPLPVSVLSSEGVKKIIAINSMPSSNMLMKSNLSQNPNFFDIMINSLYSLQYRIAKYATNDADIYMNPILPKSSWYEFYRAKEFIELGRETMQNYLPEVKNLISDTK